MGATTQGVPASSSHDEELSSLLGRENSPEADCFPLDGVMDAASGSARARTRSADLAREVLARAESEVRDLLAQDPLAADWTHRSADIVAHAQRQVREILAEGRTDVGRWQQQSEPTTLPDQAILEEGPGTPATNQSFASLRAVVLPSEAGSLRYRVSGQLTLATMLAFQYAVSRLPGVDSARVDPEPNDVAVLSMMTNDSTLVHRLLQGMSGVHLQMDSA
jgi:hypothetical protein